MHVVGGIGGQEDAQAPNLFGHTPTAAGDAIENLLAAHRVIFERIAHGGFEVSRGDAVHIDTPAAPGDRQRLGQSGDAMLRGGVSRDVQAPLEAHHRADVDDFPPAARQHVSGRLLRQIECRVQVHFHQFPPLILRVLFGWKAGPAPRVIDEDLEGTEFPHDPVDQAGPVFGAGHVGPAAEVLPTESLHPFAQRGIIAASGDARDVGSRFGQSPGHGQSQAPTGSRHQGDPPIQFEKIQNHGVTQVENEGPEQGTAPHRRWNVTQRPATARRPDVTTSGGSRRESLSTSSRDEQESNGRALPRGGWRLRRSRPRAVEPARQVCRSGSGV